MTRGALAIALLILAAPQAAEAKRFSFGSGRPAPKPMAAPAKPAAPPTAKAASGAAAQPAERRSGFVYVHTSSAPREPQSQPPADQAPSRSGALISPASAAGAAGETAEKAVYTGVPVQVMGRQQTTAAPAPGFQIVR